MHLNLKLCLLVWLGLVITATLAAKPSRGGADLSFIQFMRETRDLQINNPARSVDCFGYYSPIFDEQLADYQNEYDDCCDTADMKKYNIDGYYAPSRKWIEDNIKTSCELLGECTSLNSSKNAFACYSESASWSAKSLYNVSVNASALYVDITEDYRIIEIEQYKCTNASANRYAERTANTYSELNDCLKGLSPVPTNKPATTTTTALPNTTTTTTTTRSPLVTDTVPTVTTTDPYPTAPLRTTTASVPGQFDAARFMGIQQRNKEADIERILANLKNRILHDLH